MPVVGEKRYSRSVHENGNAVDNIKKVEKLAAFEAANLNLGKKKTTARKKKKKQQQRQPSEVGTTEAPGANIGEDGRNDDSTDARKDSKSSNVMMTSTRNGQPQAPAVDELENVINLLEDDDDDDFDGGDPRGGQAAGGEEGGDIDGSSDDLLL